MPVARLMLPSVTRPATLAPLLPQTARSCTARAIDTLPTTRRLPISPYPPPMATQPIFPGRRGWDGPGVSGWAGHGAPGPMIGTAHGAGAWRRHGALTPDTTTLTELPMALEERRHGVRGPGPLHPAICITTMAQRQRWAARLAASMP